MTSIQPLRWFLKEGSRNISLPLIHEGRTDFRYGCKITQFASDTPLMERTQARMLLRKINQLFDAVSDSGSEPSRIEVDLLQDYTRQFYATILSESAIEVAQHAAPEIPNAPPVAPDIEPEVYIEKLPVSEPVIEEVVMEARPVEVSETRPAPTVEEPHVPPTPPPTRVVEAIIDKPEVKSNGTQMVDVARPVMKSSDTEVLFATQEATDLSGKLRTSPIEDLSRAMGINERFLTINELFQSDHAAFDQTLRRLNDLPNFSAARAFLEEEVIPRYNWLDTKCQKKASVFIQLIRRRYL